MALLRRFLPVLLLLAGMAAPGAAQEQVCRASATFSQTSFDTSGGTGVATITFFSGIACTYNVVSSDTSWLTTSVPSPIPASGNSVSVFYTATPNLGPARPASLTALVNGGMVGSTGITQAANGICPTGGQLGAPISPRGIKKAGQLDSQVCLSIAVAPASFVVNAGSQAMLGITLSNTGPFASVSVALSGPGLSGGTSASAPGAYFFSVNATNLPVGPLGTLTFNCVGDTICAPQVVNIDVVAPPSCTFSANLGGIGTIPAAGSTASFTVNASPSGCSGGSWLASGSPWISLSPSSGTAAGQVTAIFSANPGPNVRPGTLTIAGATIMFNQPGAAPTAPSCTFSASPASIPLVPSGGGSAIFTVSASPSGCSGGSWSAGSDSPWIGISPSSGTAAGSVTATFAANPNPGVRPGNINIAGAGIMVNQAGAAPTAPSCTFSASPGSIPLVPSGGGSAIFTISASPSGCSGGSWSAGSDSPWIGISPSSGTAAGSATATFAANPNAGVRSGNINIAGAGIMVNQAGQIQPLQMTCSPANGPALLQQVYSTACTASGGTPPYTWSITGQLPGGLSLTNASGSSSGIAGTPQTSGSFSYGIQVRDSAGQTQTVTFTANIGGALSIGTGSLAAGVVGNGYSQALVASGGVPPYTWSLSGGTLPGGLTLAPSGAISGTPGVSGTFSFGVKVTDSTGASATQGLSIVVGTGTQNCVPSTLVIAVNTPGSGTTVSIGSPVSISLAVTDDCGNLVSAGNISVSFSDGDPPFMLSSNGNGRWSGVWTPKNAGSAVTLAFSAQSLPQQGGVVLSGQKNVQVAVSTTGAVPLISSITDGASFGPALSPGAFVSIFGSNLTAAAMQAATFPLPSVLDNTSVLVDGAPVPVVYVSPMQINAILPYSLPINTSHTVTVQQGSSISPPATINIFVTSPGVFSYGQNQGIVADVSNALISPSHPAVRGDFVIIYCSGLGGIAPGLESGAAAPSSPLDQTTNPVSVTIGGVGAFVSFSGLTPGFAGLYQINAIVPLAATAGSQVPLVVRVAGRSSEPVNIAVQ